MAERIKSITELPVGDIVVRDRLRPVSEDGVAALVSSLTDLGHMKDPIHVRKVDHRSGELVLMAGGHRLEAAMRLGWDVIPATVWRCNDDFARLMEIDDNLAGQELTALDTAVFLSARKRVYEHMHPEAGAATGADLAAKRWNAADTMSVASFAKVTATKFGLSERHIRRLVRAGDMLEADQVARLRGIEAGVRLKDLLDLSRIGDAPERAHVIDSLAEGRAKSAKDGRKLWKAERGEIPAPMNRDDTMYLRLADAWKRAPKASKRRFLASYGKEVAQLLDEASGDSDGEVIAFNSRRGTAADA